MTATRAFAIVAWGLAVVGAVGAIVVRLVTQAPFLPVTFGFGPAAMVAFITMGLSWASIGAFLVIRRPENAVGSIMVVAGAGYALSSSSWSTWGCRGVLISITGSNPLAVAASTLLVAVSFNPLRSRVQRVVDRRFHRARYDAERTVAGLAGRLRDEVDMARLRQEVLDVVDRSVEPTDVHRWLRPGPAR